MTLDGVDGLVGRDLHEAPGADGGGGVDHVEGAEHVGLGRLERVLLEDRDVLVGGGVEDDLGTVPLEGVEHRLAVEDVDQGLLGRARPGWPPCRAGGSRRGRAGPARPARGSATWRQISEPIEPPAPVTSTRCPSIDRRTDSRSVGTGVRPRRSSIWGSRAWRRAARWFGSSSMSLTPGQDLHRHAGLLRGPQRPVDQLGRRGGDGQEDLLDRVAAGGLRGSRRCRRPRARPAGTGRGPGVVVEHGDRHEAGPGAAEHLADGGGPGVAAADHGHPQPEPLRARAARRTGASGTG